MISLHIKFTVDLKYTGAEVEKSDDEDENWQGAGSDDVLTYKYGPGFKKDSPFKKLKITVIR